MEKYYTKKDLENAYEIGRYQSNILNFETFENFEEYFNQLENVGKEIFSKKDVENILKGFIKENSTTPNIDVDLVEEFIEDYIKDNSKNKIFEEKIPITYAMIKNTCGWSKWCDATNGNHYAINEFGDFEDAYVLYCTKSQFEKLF